ncbi:MAG: bacteriocin family protein [Polyangiaceae bacterium]|nr:bacteriocin family protein [Polyangiaceae bacterium]
MNLLKRELAPITPEAWAEIDREAQRVLKLHLAARKVVDFKGPFGLELGAVNTGRLKNVDPPFANVSASVRVVQPLVHLWAPFKMSIAELDTVSRGATDIDVDPLIRAAERIAAAEDHAVFHGYDAAAVQGVLKAADHAPLEYHGAKNLPGVIVGAKELLRKAGVGGPYALVLGPSIYDELHSAAEDGFPIRDRVAPMVETIVWAPALTEAAVVSMRGGDYELTVGQDLSIGFTSFDHDTVELYLTESFTFRVLSTNAAVAIRRKG